MKPTRIGSDSMPCLKQLQSVMGMSIFRLPTHCRVLCFQVYWADQLSSLWVVDSCPNFAVEPRPSSIIFIFMSMGGPPGPLPGTGPSPPVTVISTPGDGRPTRSESVHPPPRAPLPIQNRPPSRPVRAASEHVDQTGRERQPSEPERFRSRSRRSRRRRRRHHHWRHDEVPDQVARPMSAPAEPRPVHTVSPPARPPYRSASAGHMPPRPRPSTRPQFRSPDVSPDKPPGQWQPHSFTAPSQRPVLPRFRPPPSKSQAEDPLIASC